MRTTVTLDPDVAARLRALASERGISFKAALNGSIRLGLRSDDGAARAYEVPTRPLGLREGVDLDKALRLAGELEDSALVHKLELRK